jgi:CRISPR-associated protein Csm1
MDVDNLGLILSKGLPEKFNLTTLSTISRYLNLFFKVYLNRICEGNLDLGSTEALDIVGKDYKNNRGRNVSVVYSGGDDLFLVGAWDEVTELAYDIHRSFKRFTCDNPDIGISGGATLHQPTFPLYQMAKLSGEAEREAKLNFDRNPEYSYRKDSVAIFYNRYFGEQQRKIAERVRHLRDDKRIIDPGDEGKRIMLTMKWNEFGDNILNVIEWFRPFMNASDKTRLRFTIELPSGFIHKLLNLVEGWQEEGKLFIPHLMWLVKKSSAMFKNDPNPFDRQAKLITMFRDEKLKYLHIPFTWIEYLKRGGG